MVDEALEVELHLQGAVPVLKGEHGPPVQPEGGGEHLVVKDVLDGLVVQVLVRGHEELHDLHAALLAQVELPVGAGVPAPVHRGPAQGVVGVVLVEPVKLRPAPRPPASPGRGWSGTGPTDTRSGPPSPGHPASHSPGWGRKCRRRPRRPRPWPPGCGCGPRASARPAPGNRPPPGPPGRCPRCRRFCSPPPPASPAGRRPHSCRWCNRYPCGFSRVSPALYSDRRPGRRFQARTSPPLFCRRPPSLPELPPRPLQLQPPLQSVLPNFLSMSDTAFPILPLLRAGFILMA